MKCRIIRFRLSFLQALEINYVIKSLNALMMLTPFV